mmetsp:Transcript_31210/g.93649  ORF Transcript_31210/g.93649 Transcript_31210/m.93649 type:complete len:201 (+) Transcript_31210:363-965(+)
MTRPTAPRAPSGMDPAAMADAMKSGALGGTDKAAWAAKKGQTAMIFVTFNPEVDSKKKAEEIAGRWVSMLQNAHLEVKPYPIEGTRFIFIIDDGSKVPMVFDVLFKQKEFNYAEIDQKRYFGEHSYFKLNPDAEKADQARIKKRDANTQRKMKLHKVVEHRGKHKPGTKSRKADDPEKKAAKKRRKKKRKSKRSQKKTEL